MPGGLWVVYGANYAGAQRTAGIPDCVDVTEDVLPCGVLPVAAQTSSDHCGRDILASQPGSVHRVVT